MKDRIIGIDLGTATTEAAVFLNGKVQMLSNFDQSVVTPSAVGLDETGNVVIGERARAQYMLAPERTAIEIKRKMGTDERIYLGRNSYTAVDLSAMLLEYVRRFASEYLKEDVTRAVISLPAYFDDIQRKAVVEAGERAGFKVERVINEPTAAALSYGIDHMEDESYILVYDLGGGTFDVTLLEMFGGVLEVKASAGDNKLGGKDFDERLVNWLRERFEKQNGVSLKGNMYARARLKEAAEMCKITLSSQETAAVQIPMLAEKDGVPLALEETVTRACFEELIADLIAKTHGPVRRVLEDGGIEAKQLDRVLLVGGSTRIPRVSEDIEQLLGKKPGKDVNPDFSVAQGAAIQAGIISGEIDSGEGIVITDVCPYTLGVQVTDGFSVDCMSVIIPRNTTIPVKRSNRYWTCADNQSVASINIYQGESRTASRNHFLGTFDIEGIPRAKAGLEGVDVEFAYNQNGILDVKAVAVGNGNQAAISINITETGPEKENIDVKDWKNSPSAGDYRQTVRRVEKFLKDAGKSGVSQDVLEEMQELLYRLKASVIKEKLEEADEVQWQLDALLEENRG